MARPQRASQGGNDDYFTRPEIAFMCVTRLSEITSLVPKRIVEPSAGAGDFLDALKKHRRYRRVSCLSFDINPKRKRVVKRDWFSVNKNEPRAMYLFIGKDTLCVGNPPWGTSASKAVKFFNHAASMKFSYIAFIVPKTFRKHSVIKRLSTKYQIIDDFELPNDAFYIKGEKGVVSVPSCFQTWKRLPKGERRKDATVKRQTLFAFVSKDAAWDFAIRRVGGRAGSVLAPAYDRLTLSTTLFLQALPGRRKELKALLPLMRFDAVRNNTAGVRSVSKTEIVQEINRLLETKRPVERRKLAPLARVPKYEFTRVIFKQAA